MSVMSVKVTFAISGGGNLLVVGDDDSLGNWDSKKGVPSDAEVSIPLNCTIRFKVIRKISDVEVEWEGKNEYDNRTLRIVDSTYKTKDSFTIALSFNVLEDFIDIEAPPMRPRNGYQLFCEKSGEKDPVKRFFIWMSLNEAEKDVYIDEGNALWKEYKKNEAIWKVRHVNDPLPPESYPTVSEEDTIAHFLQEHPKWTSGNAYISLRDNVNFRLTPAESPMEALIRLTNYRFQKTGSCFAQASTLEHKYVLSFTEKDIRMLNLYEVLKIQGKNKASALKGGDTKDFLESIFSPETRVSRSRQIGADLYKFGPLVCARMQLDVTFKDKELKVHHVYDRMEDWGSSHATVLHGIREEDGKIYMLIQNTWKGKQFVELSAEYIDETKCVFYRVENPKRAEQFSAVIEGNCSEMNLSDENFLFDEEIY